MLSETEGIVYSKLLMKTEQDKEGPPAGGGGSGLEGGGEGSHTATQELRLFCFLRLPELLKERRPGRGKGLGKTTLRMLLDGFVF